ncbi:MAG TPA: phosphotransferase family protein [Candidatus Xenobia bacterium]|jgi:aminoglycoside phosphotransferase (APT) family kinase protein
MGLDQPKAVRAGEELDLDLLARCLETVGLRGPIEVQQFPRGFSNLTYLLRVDGTELVLRRPPVGSTVKSAHDMEREYRILAAIHPRFGRVPRPIGYFPEGPLYLMERVPGVILRDGAAPLEPSVMRTLSEATVDNLADIHRIDTKGLESLGRGEGYVERQVKGWADRYQKARTDDVPELERAITWLAEHLPAQAGSVLIHNDYKYDNLVLNPERLSDIRAVLDWEMATIGDPLMDLGTTLGYWMQADDPPAFRQLPFTLTSSAGNLTRAEVVERYAKRSGRPVDQPAFYYTFGLFKVAVIAQQIYYRFRQGLTQDERFAMLGMAVKLLGQQAWHTCQTGL